MSLKASSFPWVAMLSLMLSYFEINKRCFKCFARISQPKDVLILTLDFASVSFLDVTFIKVMNFLKITLNCSLNFCELSLLNLLVNLISFVVVALVYSAISVNSGKKGGFRLGVQIKREKMLILIVIYGTTTFPHPRLNPTEHKYTANNPV